MSRMRSSMSKKNKYYIPQERYLELLHFCRQYMDFCSRIAAIKLLQTSGSYLMPKEGEAIDLTAEAALRIADLQHKIDIIRDSAKEASPDIWMWVLSGITDNLSYDVLKLKGIPCGKDYYYEAYHKFFYFLDQKRN